MAEDFRKKIQKLLALAESDNEHEAKAALLKAKELMAEHKLTEAECKDLKSKNVKEIVTEVAYSGRKDPWAYGLSNVISANYCCKAFSFKQYKKQTRKIGFVGLEEDIDICIAVFNYAVDCIHAGQKQVMAEIGKVGNEYRNFEINSYAKGFVDGIDYAFEQQKRDKEESWGLVMIIPSEVRDACASFKKGHFKDNLDRISNKTYVQGREDGKKFDPGSRLDGSLSDRLCLA